MSHSECSSSLSLINNELLPQLTKIERGIEKEGLRVLPCAGIAQDGHPEKLGSTLTHASITTDYSEALLEFITPKQQVVESAVGYLSGLHQYALDKMGEQLIWPASMPCRLDGELSIPIANYGTSNIGQLKHVYRQGLGVRYGRIMQSIAGIHYNFSLPDAFWQAYRALFIDKYGEDTSGDNLQDFKSAHYFSLIRNFRRYSWILHYLFGASPVVDKSFIADIPEHNLQSFSGNTFGLPYATSLRMSDLGYQNSAQEALNISYDSLQDYVETLGKAIKQPYQAYEELGIQKDGQFIQLNANVLQIENEYYSDIRPKRVTQSGEKPIAALNERGVEYIEVRILDINPMIPEGINAQQMRFMDAFLLHCLFSQCPKTSNTRCQEIRGNQSKVILSGRDPQLMLEQDGGEVPFKVAAEQLLNDVMKCAELLDKAHDSFDYSSSVHAQQAKVNEADLTPSGQVMQAVKEGAEFIDFAHTLAANHKRHYASLDQDAQLQDAFAEQSTKSKFEQRNLEDSDSLSFAEFLDAYNNN